MAESMKIIHGDSLEELKKLEENSVDSVCTDPPYGWSFMGKSWDYNLPTVELWQEVLRVLKPGGHALVACGTRTQHRMAVNLEDAGFEIRDCILWLTGQGFPKSQNVKKMAGEKSCTCSGNAVSYNHEDTKYNMRSVQEGDISETQHIENEQGEVLQSGVSEQGLQELRAEGGEPETTDGKQSSVEGRELHRTGKGVQNGQKSQSFEGKKKRIRSGAHSGSGGDTGKTVNEAGGSTSHKSRQEGQQERESENISKSQGTLDGKPFPRCSKCERQILPEGLGSALKPAVEIFTLCRKPLSEKSIAENVLRWGTGGINVDGCRVGTEEITVNRHSGYNSNSLVESTKGKWSGEQEVSKGRFPANLIHDGSDEVVSGFPDTGKSSKSGYNWAGSKQGDVPVTNNIKSGVHFGDSGSAARFFYCAKAGKKERMGSTHPTMKPLALMQYLTRLITPKGGTTLDPFIGSGTTAIAAKREGFDCIGIEKKAEYVEIARARIKAEPDTLF